MRTTEFMYRSGVKYKKCKICKSYRPCNEENFYPCEYTKDKLTAYCNRCVVHTDLLKDIKVSFADNKKPIYHPMFGTCYYLNFRR